ncbi:MAG: hypothetical protein LAT57_00730 [Balneolales bacterium]|nr:hypothetical protein [Balneolales bacterium]
MSELKQEFEQVLDDVSYLLDELDALKMVVGSVPVFERPGGELSIAEHFKLANHLQNEIHINSIRPILDESYSELKRVEFSELKSSFEKKRLQAATEESEGIDIVIESLRSGRKKLLDGLTSSINELSAQQITELITSLNYLVEKERGILKLIAEHILTISRQE